MSNYKLPDVIERINKAKKTTKITTLNKAVALKMKRFFSGSFCIDDLAGGGYAYRRMQLLFGAKSAGKNAQLNQTIAYNQRICKICHGIRPDFYHLAETDRWVFTLKYYLGLHACMCEEKFEPKKALILDYERSLSYEDDREVTIKLITHKETENIIDELDYDTKLLRLETLQNTEVLEDLEKEEIKNIEKWIKLLDIKEDKVMQINATDYLQKCGVLIDELLVSDPEDTEEGIEICREVTKSKEVDMIIWDSLQAAVPKYVADRDADQATMGTEAKQNGLLVRLISSAFAAHDLTDETESYKPGFFITSQVRADLGSFVAKQPTYSGGFAVHHHISIALEIKRQNFLKEDGTEADFKSQYYGQKIRVRPEKNKINTPGGMFEYDYYFKDGDKCRTGQIDHLGEIFDLAVKYNIINQTGSYYKFLDKNIQGKAKVKEILRDDPYLVGDLYKQIKEKTS